MSDGAATDAARRRRDLQRALSVEIDDALLRTALTHRSYSYEHGGVTHNERLEFLGDSVLGLAVTVMLFDRFPELAEGGLAKRRASLVSSAALAEVAQSLELGRYLLLGRGEELSGGRQKASILADTVEAVIGAVFMDAGRSVADDLVLRLILPLMDDPDRFGVAMDPKTALQEAAARFDGAVPQYEVTTSGPDHNKHFSATVTVPNIVTARGEGTSKKQAETAAAFAACKALDSRRSDGRSTTNRA